MIQFGLYMYKTLVRKTERKDLAKIRSDEIELHVWCMSIVLSQRGPNQYHTASKMEV